MCAALVTTTRDRATAALWLCFVADSLSMPVHWFYNPADITRTFGYIRDYQPAPNNHPSSIMNLHSTGGGGRGGQSESVVGDVILKGRKQYWNQSGMHYHRGMVAGENTLNALCARLAMRSVTKNNGVYSSDLFLEDYVQFMTTEGSHNDTYAESYHRDFFSNWSKGKPPKQCAGVSHDTPSIGAFVSLPVIVLSTFHQGLDKILATVEEHLFLTHPDKKLADFARVYAETLYLLLKGEPAKATLKSAAEKIGVNVDGLVNKEDSIVIQSYGLACYITSSLPNVLYLAYKYVDDPETGILQNTNLGGENCHRGSALGALLGAATGYDKIPERWISGLKDREAIQNEINSFLDSTKIENN